MSKKIIKLHPVMFDKLVAGEKIHHLVRGKQMSEFKIGDKIEFKSKEKQRTRTIISSEPVSITNRENNSPLITFNNGIDVLSKMSCQNFSVCEGYAGLASLINTLGLKAGHTSKCKILHFTGKKYF